MASQFVTSLQYRNFQIIKHNKTLLPIIVIMFSVNISLQKNNSLQGWKGWRNHWFDRFIIKLHKYNPLLMQ